MAYLRGLSQFDSSASADLGIDTSGVAVSTPTGSQVDSILTYLEKSTCNGIWNPADNSCTGSGGSSTCPSGYVQSGFACVAAPAGDSSAMPGWVIPVAAGLGLLALVMGMRMRR